MDPLTTAAANSLRALTSVQQAFIGTLFTWFVTAAGASFVFFVPRSLSLRAEERLLDFSLGFSGGVMLAASFWSLLEPAIEHATPVWGESMAYVPAAVGFTCGAAFVWASDFLLPSDVEDYTKLNGDVSRVEDKSTVLMTTTKDARNGARRRSSAAESKKGGRSHSPRRTTTNLLPPTTMDTSTRRILLLLLAIVIHNFPEGLAVGVAFASVGTAPSATFASACKLALGIGLQNAPEGLAVSLPLRRLKGWSRRRAFFWGQLSGAVEPPAGVAGAWAVHLAEPLLPYALAFAAGAMIFVVIDSVVPESQSRGNGRLATFGSMIGFLVMMTLDVALG